ncbi:hypothetical protein WDH52_22525 [Streptomyces sp. TRM70308]|uniref:hypothetical protein n=1 Tax=Streptomyces sp. TRM70308 TaxID=3131932 RepID=UPI003D0737A3
MYATATARPEARAGLVRRDGSGAVLPDAAWHWEGGTGHRRWAFYLRPSLCDPDTGRRVSAYSFEDLWRVTAALPGTGGLPAARCRAVDAWKLIVALERPDPSLPERLAGSGLRLPAVCLEAPLAGAELGDP